ncbi:hypothetical protein J7M28_07090, partial [bacterium]|nr:hypothetical protein [bacterium]
MPRVVLIVAILMLSIGVQAEPLAPQPYEMMSGPLPESVFVPEEADDINWADPVEPDQIIALTGSGDYMCNLTARASVSPSAEEALAIVPDWLRMDLYDMFSRMSLNDQEDYGQLLLSISDPRLIDEVAFTIAHSSKSVLSATDPELYILNVEVLYQVDPIIAYADIIDYGEAGVDPDYYSTIIYTTMVSGATVQFELPRDIYYFYVVHPKLCQETPSMSPVISDRLSTYGYLWREYLLYNPSADYDYSIYFETKEPNRLQESDLDGWGPTATGYLAEGTKTCPDGIILGGTEIGKPVALTFAWNLSRTIVTTMEVETAYNSGKRGMLENLVLRSAGYNGELVTPRGDYQSQVVVVDNTGDAALVDPVVDILNSNNVFHWTMALDDMIAYDWNYFSKIIIVSHQDRAFYEKMASEEFTEKYDAWVKVVGGTFEFHGACDPEHSWAGLDLLGLEYCPEPIDDVSINKYPVLADIIGNATFVWDNSQVDVRLPSYRPFEPNSMAVDVISNWVGRMMEYQARGNRPIQPNQVCYEHNGNCGEIMYIGVAAGRACLLPLAGVNNPTWDHVSCEFWDQDWRGLQVVWNVGYADIARQGLFWDDDHGGGKALSAIRQDRGDTWPVNATCRFSKVCRFHARVEDSNGNPVDCARITTYVHLFNDDARQLASPLTSYTNSSGEVIIELGNNRDFWFDVKSRVGEVRRPADPLLTDTVADEDYEHTFVVSGTMPQLPDIEAIEFPTVPEHPYKLSVSYNVEYETQYSLSRNSFGNKDFDAGNVDFFILNSDEFKGYSDDEAFSAYERRQDSRGDEFEVEIPYDEVYYIVFSNEDTLTAKQFASIDLDIYQNDGGTWTPIENYTNFVGIPAGDAYIIMFNNKLAPSVYAAGFFDAEVDSSAYFNLGIQAFVADPNGLSDVHEVELCYGGVPLGMFLKDDGNFDDALAGDGIFTFSQGYMPGTLFPGIYRLEVQATDTAGNKSVSWPSMNVLSAPLRLSGRTCSLNTDI